MKGARSLNLRHPWVRFKSYLTHQDWSSGVPVFMILHLSGVRPYISLLKISFEFSSETEFVCFMPHIQKYMNIAFHPSRFTLWMQLLWNHWSDRLHIWQVDWSWCVVDHIIPPFWFDHFCRSNETLTFSCNFNIVILCERNSSKLVGMTAFIFRRIVNNDV